MKFHGITGVVKTRVGYTGGPTPAPSYITVCANDGHTEAIQVTFNRTMISYQQILDVFFEEHNPTVRAVRVALALQALLRCTALTLCFCPAEGAVQERDLVPQPGAGALRSCYHRFAGGPLRQSVHRPRAGCSVDRR